MAFGDSLRPTDGATVVLNVDTSQTQKLEQAEAQWRESVGTMSREALKLDLAQDRLKKSLSAYGAESAQAKRATIALKDAEEANARAADKLTRETQQLTSAQSRQHTSTRRMVGTVAGLAGAYFGTQGLINATRAALKASSNHAEQMDFARRTFEAAFPVVENFANNALGLARDQAYEAAAGIGALLKPLGVAPGEAARLSVELSKLGVDFASMRNARLEDVLIAIRSGLVGESEPLRRFSVLLSEARVQQVALAQSGKESVDQLTNEEKVRARIAIIFRDGAQAVGNYADTIGGSANQEREAQKNLRNTAILIGDTLQPAYRELLGQVNDYLGSAENQRRIQEQVNKVVETGEDVVRGFAGALRIAKGILDPFVDAVGGAENAVKLLLLAFGVSKIAGALAGVGRLLAAIRLIGPASVASAATSVAAMNTIGTAATVNAGKIGALRAALFGLPGAALVALGIFGAKGLKSSFSQKAIDDQEFQKLLAAAASGQMTKADLERLKPALTTSQYNALRSLIASRGSNIPDEGGRHTAAGTGTGAPAGGGSGGGGGGGQSGPSLADLQLNVARAGASPGKADDVRALQALRAYYARQIRVLEARKNLTAEQKEKLRALYGDIASTQSQLDAIAEAGEAKLAAQREEAERKRDAAREAAMERAMRRAQRRYDLLGDIPGTRAGMRRAALRHVNAVTRGLQGKKSPSEQMREEFRRMSFDFLTGLQGVTNQWGSNVTMGGDMAQVASHAGAQTMLLREQNRVLDRLTRSVQHPGAKYARVELAGLYGGVGGI